jgi:aspartate aminotransferase
MQLHEIKKEGLPVDCITPEAAIYLTIKIDAAGRKTPRKNIRNTR